MADSSTSRNDEGDPAAEIRGAERRREELSRELARRELTRTEWRGCVVGTAEARLGRSLTADERAEAYQVSTFATRPAKGCAAEATESLVERWTAGAAALGRSAGSFLGIGP